jgi:hypothetical protein
MRMMRQFVIIASTFLSTCGGDPVDPPALVGSWELAAATHVLGSSEPAPLHFALFISCARGDSLFGTFTALEPDTTGERGRGDLRGLASNSRVQLTAFTIDDPAMDIIIDARFRRDSLIVGRMRPRSGKNALGPGMSLVFVRRSTESASGRLTSACS